MMTPYSYEQVVKSAFKPECVNPSCLNPKTCSHYMGIIQNRFEIMIVPNFKNAKNVYNAIYVDRSLANIDMVRNLGRELIACDRELTKHKEAKRTGLVVYFLHKVKEVASKLINIGDMSYKKYVNLLGSTCYQCAPHLSRFTRKQSSSFVDVNRYSCLDPCEEVFVEEDLCSCCSGFGYPLCQECYVGCDCRHSRMPPVKRKEEWQKLLKDFRSEVFEEVEEEFVLVRNPKLLFRIRELRRLLRISHVWSCDQCRCVPTTKEWVYCQLYDTYAIEDNALKDLTEYFKNDFKFESSGDQQNGPHGDDSLRTIQHNDTILTETQVPSVTTGPHDLSNLWNRLSSSDKDGIYNQLTQRWIPIKSLTWGSSEQNVALWKGELPFEILKSYNMSACDIPLSMIFRTHQYCNFDTMHIKIHLNSNKFQVGQIQAVWWYEPSMDSKFQYRDNIWVGSQNHHVLLNAGSSNDATLAIPWVYRKTYLTCKKMDGMEKPLRLGQLSIRVLNPLTTPETNTKMAYITVFISFDNLRFNGLKAGNFGTFESGGEERVRADSQVLQPTKNIETSDYGRKLFGEHFGDLKTLCRRYQYYGTFSGTVKETIEGIGKILCEIPLLAQGLELVIPAERSKKGIESFTNLHRDGHIPVILSGYRYFRGGLRFKFICPRIADVNFVVQHKPPLGYLGDKIIPCNSTKKNSDFLLHTVATYVQNLGTNSIVEIEVPFYSPGCYTLLQNPKKVDTEQRDSQSFYSLGSLLLSFDFVGKGTPTFKGDWSIPVYYSLADDARAILFQGFSPMVLLDNINTPLQYEMDVVKDVLTIGSLRLLDSLASDNNRDNPPEPIPPAPYILRNTSSWCNGTGVSAPLNVLRLNALGQTRFPGNVSTDEMTCDYLKRIWGLVSTITWTKNDAQNTMIKSYRASPLLHAAEYKSWAKANKLTTYALPPVSVLSSLFAYWRGSLEFRFDFVASQFHTGRLLIAYIPGYDGKNVPSLAQARCSPFVEFTLNEDEQCIFKIPYIADRPWWPRTVTYGDSTLSHSAPSTIVIYVLNPLIPMESVSSSVFINVYMRGGEDFEVSVPTQPVVGCNRNIEYTLDPSAYHIVAVDGYDPYYGGTWRYCYDSTRKMYPIIFRYGNISDHVVQFEEPSKVGQVDWTTFTYWKAKTSGSLPIIKNSTTAVVYNLAFMVLWKQKSFWYGIPVIDDDAAKNAAKLIATPEYDIKLISTYLMDSSSYDLHGATYGTKGINWLPVKVPNTVYAESDKDQDTPSTFKNKLTNLFSTKDSPPGPSTSQAAQDKPVKKTVVEKITDQVSDAIGEAVSEKCSDALTKITQAVETSLDSMKDEIDEKKRILILNGVTNLMHCIINPNWKTVALSFTSFLMSIGILATKYLKNAIEVFSRIFRTLRSWTSKSGKDSAKETPEDESITTEATELPQASAVKFESDSLEADVSELLAILCSSFCYGFSWKNKPEHVKKAWSSTLMSDLGIFARTTNQLLIFTRNLFNVIRNLFDRVVDWVSPEIYAAKRLKEILPSLRTWGEECMTLLHPENKHKLMIDGAFQARVVSASSYACLIRSHMLDESMPNSAAVLTMCSEIIALRNSMTRMGRSPTIRKTPWCVYFVGPTGVGKSYMYEEVSTALLKHVGYPLRDVPKTYTYNRASEFWSGCTGKEPIFYMDDAFTTRDSTSLVKECNVIYQAVSTSILQPVMAELADKNMYWAPEIMWINSNIAYPNESCMAHKEAIYSRRHVMVHVRLSPEFKTKYPIFNNLRDVPKEVYETDEKFANFGYLEFGFYPNVLTPSEPEEWMGYERFLLTLKNNFKNHYEKEQMGFDRRINALYDAYDSNIERIGRELIEHDKELTAQTLDEKYVEIRAKCLKDLKANRVKNGLTVPFIRNNKLVRKFSNLKFWSAMLSVPSFFRKDKVKHEQTVENIVERGEETPYTRIAVPPEIIQKPVEEQDEEFGENLSDIEIEYFVKFGRVPTPHEAEAYAFVKNTRKTRPEGPVTVEDTKKCGQNIESILNRWNMSEDLKNHLLTMVDNKNFESLTELEAFSPPGFFPHKSHNISGLIKSFKSLESTNLPACAHINLLYCSWQYSSQTREFMYMKHGNFFSISSDSNGCTSLGRTCVLKNKLFCYLLFKQYNQDPHQRIKVLDKQVNLLPSIFIPFLTDESPFLKWIEKYTANLKILYKEKLSPCLKSIWEFASGRGMLFICNALALLMTVMGVGYMGFVGYKTATDPAWGCPSAPTPQGGRYDVKDAVPKSMTIPDRVLKQSANTEYRQSLKLIQNNLCNLVVLFNNSLKFRKFQILMLKNRLCIFILHYYQEMQYLFSKYDDAKLYFVEGVENEARYIPLNFPDLQPKWFTTSTNDSNFGILELPVRIRMFRDITKFIAKKNQHNAFGTECVFVHREFMQETDGKIAESFQIMPTEECSGIDMDIVYTYPISKAGYCGSVLTSKNLSKGIIVGMHVAGDGRRGISEPIYYEMFAEIKEQKTEIECVSYPQFDDTQLAKIMPDTDIYPLGVISSDLAHSESGKTQIIPSEISGVFPVRTEPNPLRADDERLPPGCSPMKLGVEKHGVVPRGFPESTIKKAYESLKDKILANCKPVVCKMEPFPLEDVVCGNVEIPHCESLNWTSAEGFFLNKFKPAGMKGKKWLFDLEETAEGYKLKGMHKVLKQQLALKDALRKRKIRPFTVFTDCLKDTRLPKEKCSVPGKTRIFSTSPVDFQIQFKQYYQNFISSYQYCRHKLEHAIGIDVDSLEWTTYFRLLQVKGTKVVSGDYSNFGPGMLMECVWYAFQIIIDWYEYYGASSEYLSYLAMLRDEIINANHLCFNLVYTVASSIPSGSPITTPLNSLVNCLYIRCCYYEIFKTLSDFDENVSLVTYGDDIVINIRDEICEKFNLQTMSDMFLKYGIVFTHCSKSVNYELYESIFDITFLKRKWIPHPYKPNIYLAGLDKVSIEDTANWITKKNNLREGSLLNSEQCVLNSFGWGPEYYNYIKNKLIEEWRQLHQHVVYKEWHEIDNEKYNL